MRIAVLNRHNRIVGGVEQYLAASAGRLISAGHDVCLWSEEIRVERSDDRAVIDCPTRHVPWIGKSGRARLMYELAGYNADVVCVHSPLDFDIETALLSKYPGVFFGHDYSVTCISGGKTLHGDTDRPCTRKLGPGCLGHYYPHRCGGLNPITMMRNYLLNERRRQHLEQYSAIVTFSHHMAFEYRHHGIPQGRVKVVTPLVTGPAISAVRSYGDASTPTDIRVVARSRPEAEICHIGFLGRFEPQKGVAMLLRALPEVAHGLGRRLIVFLAGAGSELTTLQTVADAVIRECELVSIHFRKWVENRELDDFYSKLDLLVVPSIWPEPFGLVGLEASAHGVPVAAFAVGGIPDWLHPGINGHLAPGDPPTSNGLAQAMIECLRDPAHHARLREGGPQVARLFSAERHITALTSVLHEAVDGKRLEP